MIGKIAKNKIHFSGSDESVIVNPTVGHILKARKKYSNLNDPTEAFEATAYIAYLACKREEVLVKQGMEDATLEDFIEDVIEISPYFSEEDLEELKKEAEKWGSEEEHEENPDGLDPLDSQS